MKTDLLHSLFIILLFIIFPSLTKAQGPPYQPTANDLKALIKAAKSSVNSCGVNNDVITSPDAIICIGDSVQLSAVAPYSFPFWFPATGLDDAYSSNPIASPTSSQYYYFLQIIENDSNLIFNGDFELGDVGFTSDYDPAPNNWNGIFVDPEGKYKVENNPSQEYVDFEECRDHTGNSGNMMMVNGSDDSDDAVWCQAVAVNPAQGYQFEAWFTSLNKKTPATLMVEINGVQLGNDIDLGYWTCDWEQFTGTWYSGNSTVANICIYDLEESEHGNDFAIDDISFTSICPFYDSVYIEVSDLEVSATVTNIPCYEDGFGTIEASINATASTTFSWQEFPNDTSLTLNNLAAGTYTLNVDDATGCSRVETFEITQPDSLYSILTVDSTNCEGGILDASPVSGGTTPYTFLWSDGSSTDMLTELDSGYYSVTITDANNCLWSDAALMNNIPLLNAELTNDSLTCDTTDFATIQALVLEGTAPYTYSWSTNESTDNIQVYTPGNYSVNIVDQNGCEVTLTTNIWQPYRPQLDLYIDPAVDNMTIFQGSETVLYSSNNGNPNTSFNWMTSDDVGLGTGNMQAENLSLNPVDTGMYWVYLDVSSDDGCFANDSLQLQVLELPFVGIPTAFTPNGDGANETFYPIDVPKAYIQSFQIYNRWGEVVYDIEKDPYDLPNGLKGWDGTFSGKAQPQEVYIYVLVLDFPGFEDNVIRGQVTLLR
jgi:gliding motility-associated-like protein